MQVGLVGQVDLAEWAALVEQVVLVERLAWLVKDTRLPQLS